jgi:hypothetical protein
MKYKITYVYDMYIIYIYIAFFLSLLCVSLLLHSLENTSRSPFLDDPRTSSGQARPEENPWFLTIKYGGNPCTTWKIYKEPYVFFAIPPMWISVAVKIHQHLLVSTSIYC